MLSNKAAHSSIIQEKPPFQMVHQCIMTQCPFLQDIAFKKIIESFKEWKKIEDKGRRKADTFSVMVTSNYFLVFWC